jgi:hypothetical protein
MSDSPAVHQLPDDLQLEYVTYLAQCRRELEPIKGVDTVCSMLLERYTLVYCMLRDIERDYSQLDLQRYNQLLGIWLKIGSDLLEKYRDLYRHGAANQIMASEIFSIIAEEISDPEVLTRIRARIEVAARETAKAGSP